MGARIGILPYSCNMVSTLSRCIIHHFVDDAGPFEIINPQAGGFRPSRWVRKPMGV
jgi:hypothetical protein